MGRAGLIPSGPWPTANFLFFFQKESKQSLSALRAAYGGCAPRRAFCEADVPEGARSDPSGLGAEMLTPYKSISPSAEGDQGAALDRSPDGAMPLRVLQTWAAPNVGYAQPFEKGGPKL